VKDAFGTLTDPKASPAGPLGWVQAILGEPDWIGEWSTGKTTTADTLKNPLATGAARARPPGPEVPILPREAAAAGDTLYQYYCTVCHGATGAADGPVSRQMAAPSLLTARARAYSDGYLYSIIRYGRGLMPRYGDKVYSPLRRWAIVSHVRALQRAAPVAGDPKATTPIPPSASVTGSTGGYPQ
jgi:mono/diheme cytochrome c family protein